MRGEPKVWSFRLAGGCAAATLVLLSACSSNDEAPSTAAAPDCGLEQPPEAGRCDDFNVPFLGDKNACGFPDAGILHGSDCVRYCGKRFEWCALYPREVPPLDGGVIGCHVPCLMDGG
jgi:hypothetical protein